MILKEFLSFIQDEEARIELEVDDGKDEDIIQYFWLSDYRSNLDIIKYYNDYTIKGFSFLTNKKQSDIVIFI